ncbi:MAG: Outer membrane protein TolC [bacterium]|nr:Outer membrane protein TolC [bacterium]
MFESRHETVEKKHIPTDGFYLLVSIFPLEFFHLVRRLCGLVLAVFSCMFLSLPLQAQTAAVHLDSLTLEHAVTLALQHHPALKAAQASVHASSAALTQARAAYFPAVNLSTSTTRTEGAFVFNPSFPPRDQRYTNYVVSLQAQQTLYDFGKTGDRVAANENFAAAAALDADAARQNVIANVKLAYLNYIQTARVVKVNAEAVAQAEQHLVRAKAFYSVGKRPEFDVTNSEVDLANAKVNLIRGRNLQQLAKVQLENAMGVHPATNYSVSESFVIPPLHPTLDSAKTIAFAQRSELRSARARLQANQAFVAAAWNQHLPTLSASGSYIWSAFDFPLFSRWNAGVTLSLPVFQGFNISAQVQQAKANADVAQANFEVLIENITLEVEQVYLSLQEANERIAAASKLVEQAEQNLKLAEARYNSGVGSPIEITDAQLSRSNARITQIQAQYDYNSALVRLRLAMGIAEQ